MLHDDAAPLVIEAAKGLITLVRGIEPHWRKAYLRFISHDSSTGVKASYEHESGVEIIDVMKHKEFFRPFHHTGQRLLAAVGKTEGLFLIVTDSSFDYEIKFEYDNMERWKISKIDGGTGIPEGL